MLYLQLSLEAFVYKGCSWGNLGDLATGRSVIPREELREELFILFLFK